MASSENSAGHEQIVFRQRPCIENGLVRIDVQGFGIRYRTALTLDIAKRIRDFLRTEEYRLLRLETVVKDGKKVPRTHPDIFAPDMESSGFAPKLPFEIWDRIGEELNLLKQLGVTS